MPLVLALLKMFLKELKMMNSARLRLKVRKFELAIYLSSDYNLSGKSSFTKCMMIRL